MSDNLELDRDTSAIYGAADEKRGVGGLGGGGEYKSRKISVCKSSLILPALVLRMDLINCNVKRALWPICPSAAVQFSTSSRALPLLKNTHLI